MAFRPNIDGRCDRRSIAAEDYAIVAGDPEVQDMVEGVQEFNRLGELIHESENRMQYLHGLGRFLDPSTPPEQFFAAFDRLFGLDVKPVSSRIVRAPSTNDQLAAALRDLVDEDDDDDEYDDEYDDAYEQHDFSKTATESAQPSNLVPGADALGSPGTAVRNETSIPGLRRLSPGHQGETLPQDVEPFAAGGRTPC